MKRRELLLATLGLSLPLLPSAEAQTQVPLSKDWQAFRVKVAKDLLATLFQTAHRAVPELPLLMRERKFDFNIEPWTDPCNELGQEASERTVVVAAVSPGAKKDWRRLRDEITSERREHGRGKSKSLILDLLLENPGGDNLELLTAIVPYVTVL